MEVRNNDVRRNAVQVKVVLRTEISPVANIADVQAFTATKKGTLLKRDLEEHTLWNTDTGGAV